MKYKATPGEVKAFRVISVGPALPDGSMQVGTDDGENRAATCYLMSRYFPRTGDYWVIQPDGSEALLPKDVFEHRYWPVSSSEGGKMKEAIKAAWDKLQAAQAVAPTAIEPSVLINGAKFAQFEAVNSFVTRNQAVLDAAKELLQAVEES